eukprot:m.34320 g.34320  ORF g.34320 m.34320 type:complete len:376 (-) comp12638_c0_seq1:277-1404(-)
MLRLHRDLPRRRHGATLPPQFLRSVPHRMAGQWEQRVPVVPWPSVTVHPTRLSRCVSVLLQPRQYLPAILTLTHLHHGHATACSDVRRNHQFCTVVEDFLGRNPHRRRSAVEIADMDKKDKFTNENLRVRAARPVRNRDDYDDDDEYSEDEDGSEVEEEDEVCHECDYGAANPPPPDGFSCGAGAASGHLECAACHTVMPNRIADVTSTRPQRCVCCSRGFCNMYYEYKGGCGVTPLPDKFRLRKLVDEVKTELSAHALQGNSYEIGLVLEMTGTDGVNSIWGATDMGALIRAVFPFVAAASLGDGSDAVACGICSDMLWRRAIDDWRWAADTTLVPAHAQSRPICWYGRDCRTQIHNAGHASRFNHICDRTAPP